jgi:hypothetical protein
VASQHLLGRRLDAGGVRGIDPYRPELGPIEVDCQVLFTEDQSQALLVLTAPPRTEAYEKLQLLAVLGQEHFGPVSLG